MFVFKIRHGSVYLCGHLHTMGGLVPNMYAYQQSGYLELELADWKDSRLYVTDYFQFQIII